MSRTGFVHQALCYASDEEFLDGTLAFVRDGLAAGDAVLSVVQTRNIALLRDALRGEADADAVEFVDAKEWYGFPARTLGQYHAYCTRHEDGGARRVRVIGEPLWTGRTAFETREWMRYESLLNVAFADSGHWILCPYDTRVLPAAVVRTAARTHPELARGPRGWVPSGGYAPPDAFYAECDEALGPPERVRPERELRFGRGRSAAVRSAAAGYARRCGLPQERAHDLVAAVHEAALNAVRFGGGEGLLRLWCEPGYVVCEVSDTGRARSAAGDPPSFPGHLPPEPRGSGGHGLWVVRQLSDLVTERMRADGSVLRMRFSR
ncbi:sensor histidine kinase [Streptomyces boncukensis]|uniref:Sensor histidine kinase n=1 Tax=Streptomyces boncukensis TaxID=2711219 RepID=A0A6G4WVQ1_9ACTN|nr:sensor histidine kinase [Streptomyces boncukensis]NGO69083.1 sensor histidine kinase [Streptomyces boncukensis]